MNALGQTVLHRACESGNVDLVRLLISEYGSDPMARDSAGDTPLHVAALSGREEEVVDRYKCPCGYQSMVVILYLEIVKETRLSSCTKW